jgi:hypothetical protein
MRELKLGGSLCNLLDGRRNFNEKLLSELMVGRLGGWSLSPGDRTQDEIGIGPRRGGIRRIFQGQLGIGEISATVKVTVGGG